MALRRRGPSIVPRGTPELSRIRIAYYSCASTKPMRGDVLVSVTGLAIRWTSVGSPVNFTSPPKVFESRLRRHHQLMQAW